MTSKPGKHKTLPPTEDAQALITAYTAAFATYLLNETEERTRFLGYGEITAKHVEDTHRGIFEGVRRKRQVWPALTLNLGSQVCGILYTVSMTEAYSGDPHYKLMIGSLVTAIVTTIGIVIACVLPDQHR